MAMHAPIFASSRLALLALTLCLLAMAGPVHAADAKPNPPDPANWSTILDRARGQTVYWHGWGGSTRVNDYIAWTGTQLARRFGVQLEHVKLADTADAVSRVVAEKAAGKNRDGAVDLIWINGENFAAMKREDLLFGPWAEQLPNWRYVDVAGKPAVTRDFTVPTEGLEAPWGMAQLIFYHDSARLAEPPRSMPALLDWARANPGRFTFPKPPDFLGTTFLKQALYELAPNPDLLLEPVSQTDHATVTAPLWRFIDELKPHLWRGGRVFPQNGPRQIQLMADGEIDLAISFNPSEPSAAIADFELPDSVRSYVLEDGTIGNASFVAIPYNASAKAGAMVVANFLLSPEAQAHKQDPEIWGSATVLDLDKLPAAARRRFENLDLGVATLGPEALGRPLPEPHPSWMERLEADWAQRYTASP